MDCLPEPAVNPEADGILRELEEIVPMLNPQLKAEVLKYLLSEVKAVIRSLTSSLPSGGTARRFCTSVPVPAAAIATPPSLQTNEELTFEEVELPAGYQPDPEFQRLIEQSLTENQAGSPLD